MKYESKKTITSVVEPGVTFTIKMLGAAARAKLELATSEARSHNRDIAIEWNEINSEMLEILPVAEYPGMSDDEITAAEKAREDALTPEQRNRYNRLLAKRLFLNDEYRKVEVAELAPEWIRAGLLKLEGIEGASGKLMTTDELIDFGPQELMQEIYGEIYKSTNLSADRAKNSQSPSTLAAVVDGATTTTTAPSASEAGNAN